MRNIRSKVVPLYYAGSAAIGFAFGFWDPFIMTMGVAMVSHAFIELMGYCITEDV